MTLKEKVTEMEPEKVSQGFRGGVEGCPGDYEYLNDDSISKNCEEYMKNCRTPKNGACDACWNREFVPEEEESEKEKLIERLEDLCDAVPFTDCSDGKCPFYEKYPLDDDCEWSVENNTAEGIKNQIRTLEAYLKMREESDKPTESTTTPSAIDHPSHYNQGGVECIDAIKAATVGLSGFEGFCAGNAIKYLFRWKHKNGVEDLKKGAWFMERLIKEIENE